jgi:hypothetical protein
MMQSDWPSVLYILDTTLLLLLLLYLMKLLLYTFGRSESLFSPRVIFALLAS